jgi:hypothetical protein
MLERGLKVKDRVAWLFAFLYTTAVIAAMVVR